MITKTITLKEYNQRINNYNQLKRNGFKFIVKKNYFKIGLGCVCLGIALIPNGLGIIFYPLSVYLIGFNLMDIKRKTKNKIKQLAYNTKRGYRV